MESVQDYGKPEQIKKNPDFNHNRTANIKLSNLITFFIWYGGRLMRLSKSLPWVVGVITGLLIHPH
jgi:hypothetical protein